MANFFTILFEIALKALFLLKQHMARVSITDMSLSFVYQTLADLLILFLVSWLLELLSFLP